MDIFLNKIPYTPQWKLDLTIQHGSMIDYETWVTDQNYSDHFDQEFDSSSQKLYIEIFYDDVILLKKQAVCYETINVSYELLDDIENIDHVLKIVMSGKTDNHSFKDVNGREIVAMIQVQLRIEDLPINECILDHTTVINSNSSSILTQPWTKFIGVNSEHLISIKTPIYRWLFTHEVKILEEMKRLGQIRYPFHK